MFKDSYAKLIAANVALRAAAQQAESALLEMATHATIHEDFDKLCAATEDTENCFLHEDVAKILFYRFPQNEYASDEYQVQRVIRLPESAAGTAPIEITVIRDLCEIGDLGREYRFFC